MSNFVSGMIRRVFFHYVALGVIFVIGLPFFFFHFRPDLDVMFYLSKQDADQLVAGADAVELAENQYVAISGNVDPERSYLKTGFSSSVLVVGLKGYPEDLLIRPSEGKLTKSVTYQYKQFSKNLSDADRIIGAFGKTRQLSDFLDQDSPVLSRTYDFRGRVYKSVGGNFPRYHGNREIPQDLEGANWLLVDRDLPSFSGLMESNAFLFFVAGSFAALLGIPAMLLMASSWSTKKRERLKRDAAEPVLVTASRVASRDTTRYTPHQRLTADGRRVVQNSFDIRLQEYLQTDHGKAIEAEFYIPYWMRYVACISALVIGLVLLPTIVYTPKGLGLIWRALSLQDFRRFKKSEIAAGLRVLTGSVVFSTEEVMSGAATQGAALILTCVGREMDYPVAKLHGLARRLVAIYEFGPADDAELAVHEILQETGLAYHCPKNIPEAIDGRDDLVLIHVLLDVRQCRRDAMGVAVACVSKLPEAGETYQIPWAVIEDLV